MTARQVTYVKQVCNRKETTWWEPRSQLLDRVQSIAVKPGTRSWSEVSLTILQGGASVSTPWLLEEDMGRSPLSEYMSRHHLSHTTETSTLSRIKCERYIFIKKCVRSFIEVRKLYLIMFPFVFVCGYTTRVRTTNVHRSNKRKWFRIKKEKKQRISRGCSSTSPKYTSQSCIFYCRARSRQQGICLNMKGDKTVFIQFIHDVVIHA